VTDHKIGILELAAVGDDGVPSMCWSELDTGERHRNAELINVRVGKLVETQVYRDGRRVAAWPS
jgi:hypothetical protein